MPPGCLYDLRRRRRVSLHPFPGSREPFMPASGFPAFTLALCLALSGAVALCSPGASSATTPPPGAVTDTLRTAEDCLECHAPGADLAKYGIPPEKLFDPAAEIDYRIAPDDFRTSNHGKLACRICHVVGKELYPHLEAAMGRNFNCTDCHERQVEEAKFEVHRIRREFEVSVHAEKLGDRFSCHSCHDPHVFRLTTPEKKQTEIVADDNEICLRCHDAPERFASLTDRTFPIIRRTHGWLHDLELHWSVIRCVRCHTVSAEQFDHRILAGNQAENSCSVCHFYLMGVTRDVVLDWRSLAVVFLALVGVAGRFLIRRGDSGRETS